MATAAKTKPVKAPGKQKAKRPSLQTSSSKYTSTWDEEHFDGQFAAMQDFGDELQSETMQCEQVTKEAIRVAQPAKKPSGLNAGLEEWKRALCASAGTYYNTFFKVALNHRDDLGGKKPADFAKTLTNLVVSSFLRISALDGEEIDSNGRVREFIRHACDDSPNAGSDPAPVAVFQLPYWVGQRSFGSRIGLSESEYAEGFILGEEAKLTAGLRVILARAHRKAVIETAQTPAPRSANTPTAESPKTYKRFKRTDKVCFRLGVIFRAIEARKTGLDYCDFLRDGGLTTPDSWRGDSCPESYSLAYQKAGRLGRLFRHRINTEHSRNGTLRSKLEREDPAELKRILDISRRPKP